MRCTRIFRGTKTAAIGNPLILYKAFYLTNTTRRARTGTAVQGQGQSRFFQELNVVGIAGDTHIQAGVLDTGCIDFQNHGVGTGLSNIIRAEFSYSVRTISGVGGTGAKTAAASARTTHINCFFHTCATAAGAIARLDL